MSLRTVQWSIVFVRQGSLGETLKEARPTSFLGVPRVWEKMQEAMVAAAKANSSFKRQIALWAKDVGLKGNMAVMNGFVVLSYHFTTTVYVAMRSCIIKFFERERNIVECYGSVRPALVADICSKSDWTAVQAIAISANTNMHARTHTHTHRHTVAHTHI